jgi:hypothetical protein
MTRADRAVLTLALLLLLGAFVVPRAILWLDPVADNVHRAHFELLHGDYNALTSSLWTDANDAPLPFQFPPRPGDPLPPPVASRSVGGVQRDVAYASHPALPRDRWGNRWILVVRFSDDGMFLYHVAIYSSGPNGRFEWGMADDIYVGPERKTFKRNWWPLAVIAGAIALPYLSMRLLRLPRSDSLAKELSVTSLIAVGPVAAALVVIVLGFSSLDSLPIGWGVVSPRFVVFFTVAFVVWLLILGARLKLKAP